MLTDKALIKAVKELCLGLHNGNLGASCFKKRIALPGRGKQGGARTIIAFRPNKHTFFLYGYPKNKIENISSKDKEIFKKTAKELLNIKDSHISDLIDAGDLVEAKNDK